jgi:hypothetical protein
MTIYIYALFDPRTDDSISENIRYIGKTKMKLQKRLQSHIDNTRRNTSNYHSMYWIRKLLKEGVRPSIRIIEVCDENNWQEREKYWIKQFNNLTNYDEGGGSNTIFKKPVHQFSLNGKFIKTYDSIEQASLETGINRQSISIVVNNKNKKAGDYLWSFKYSYSMPPYYSHKNTITRITNIETGENILKESLQDALKYFNLKICGNVNRCIKNKIPYKKRYYIQQFN